METERKSKKWVPEGENYRSLCHCLLMSWKPHDHIALAAMVQCAQTVRHSIGSMWKVLCSYVTVEKKKKIRKERGKWKRAKRKKGRESLMRSRKDGEIQTSRHRRKEWRLNGGERGRLPKDDGEVFECLSCALAPTADQRQRSGWALSGIKSH